MIDTFSKISSAEIEEICKRNRIGITFTNNGQTYTKTKTELVAELNTIYQPKSLADKREMLLNILQEGRTLVKIYQASQILRSSTLPQVAGFIKTTNGNITTYIPNNLSDILTAESYAIVDNTNLIYVLKKFLQNSKIVAATYKVANLINNHPSQTVSMTYIPSSVTSTLFSSIKNQKLCTRFAVQCNGNFKFRIFYEYHKIDSAFITFNTKINSNNRKIYKQINGLNVSNFDGIDSLSTSATLFSSTATDDAIDYTIVKLPLDIQRDIKQIRVNILIKDNTRIERYLIGFLGSEIQIYNLDFQITDLPLIGKIISYVR